MIDGFNAASNCNKCIIVLWGIAALVCAVNLEVEALVWFSLLMAHLRVLELEQTLRVMLCLFRRKLIK